MIEFVSFDEARARRGMRLVVVPGVPSPWGEAAKGILQVKKIPFCAVKLEAGNPDFVAWAGEASAPVTLFDDEKPHGGWAEILLQAERIAPAPALIPSDPAARAHLFGVSHEICGRQGLGWARRIAGIHGALESGGESGFPLGVAQYLADKYGYDEAEGKAASGRVVDLLGLLIGLLKKQKEDGSRYYIGDSLTALDIYSATFTAMFEPLPPEDCPMPDALRAVFEEMDDATRDAFDPILTEHRDFIYRTHLELPLTLIG